MSEETEEVIENTSDNTAKVLFNSDGNLPIFATGDSSVIQLGIEMSLLPYPAFVFMPDKEGVAFIDEDSNIIELGRTQVLRVDELPPVEKGDTGVLYICDDMVYFFTGEEYKPVATNTNLDLDEVKEQLEENKRQIESLDKDMKQAQEDIKDLDTNISEINANAGVKFINMDELMASIEATAVISSIDALEEALNDDNILFIIFDDDLEFTTSRGLRLREDVVKYVDLNGHNLTVHDENTSDSVYAVYVSNGGTLNLYDSVGTSVVDAGDQDDYNVCLCVTSGGIINVYGGHYTCGTVNDDSSGSITVYAYDGKINLYDGYFENESWNDRVGNYSILNLKNNSGSYILCYGGQYLDQDPADGDETDKETGATFLADGYMSVPSEVTKNDETHILYTVVEQEV